MGGTGDSGGEGNSQQRSTGDSRGQRRRRRFPTAQHRGQPRTAVGKTMPDSARQLP